MIFELFLLFSSYSDCESRIFLNVSTSIFSPLQRSLPPASHVLADVGQHNSFNNEVSPRQVHLEIPKSPAPSFFSRSVQREFLGSPPRSRSKKPQRRTPTKPILVSQDKEEQPNTSVDSVSFNVSSPLSETGAFNASDFDFLQE